MSIAANWLCRYNTASWQLIWRVIKSTTRVSSDDAKTAVSEVTRVQGTGISVGREGFGIELNPRAGLS
jgi:hypothetical protein